jgi:membrane-associated protease RseP (regulator of RpoE activity)
MSAATPPAPGAERRRPRLLVHIGLLLATFLTTTATGALVAHAQAGTGAADWRAVIPISDGLSYSVPLLVILLCHELGHYIVARLHGVDASLPYFIPLPPTFGLGTMGAVIGMRNVTADRKKLIDIGAAGPLAGLIVAVPIILYGLSRSNVGPLMPGGQQEGNSFLYAVLKYVVTGAWLPDGRRDVFLHPTAWAGWAGLLVTMINLLPIGQLDGGHIATAYFGNGYNRFARRLHRVMPLVAVGVFGWIFYVVRAEAGASGSVWDQTIGLSIAAGAALPWLVWYALVSVVRRVSGGSNHPPVDDQPLPPSRRALFWLMVVVFIGIFMPVPLRATYTPPPAPPDPAASIIDARDP